MKIKMDEWLRELDQYRARPVKFTFSKDQDKYLIAARDNPRPVTWTLLSRLMKRHFEIDVSATTLRRHYDEIKMQTTI